VKSVVLDSSADIVINVTVVHEAEGVEVPGLEEEPESGEEEESECNPQDNTVSEARAGHVDGANRTAAVGCRSRDSVAVGLGRCGIGLLLTIALLELAVSGLLGTTVGLGSVADGSDWNSGAGPGHTTTTGVLARSLIGAIAKAYLRSLHVHANLAAVGLYVAVVTVRVFLLRLVGALRLIG